MSTAREVLDAIDRVLDDHSVSDDAMRWTPQQESDRRQILARRDRQRIHAVRIPPPVDPERAAEAWRALGERWLALVEALRPAMQQLGEAMQQAGSGVVDGLAAQIREVTEEQRRRNLGIPPRARDALRDTDPRAYALARQRARGTGPDRQVQHRRPPRTIR